MTCFIQVFLAKIEREDKVEVAAIEVAQKKKKRKCVFCKKNLPKGMTSEDHDCLPF